MSNRDKRAKNLAARADRQRKLKEKHEFTTGELPSGRKVVNGVLIDVAGKQWVTEDRAEAVDGLPREFLFVLSSEDIEKIYCSPTLLDRRIRRRVLLRYWEERRGHAATKWVGSNLYFWPAFLEDWQEVNSERLLRKKNPTPQEEETMMCIKILVAMGVISWDESRNDRIDIPAVIADDLHALPDVSPAMVKEEWQRYHESLEIPGSRREIGK